MDDGDGLLVVATASSDALDAKSGVYGHPRLIDPGTGRVLMEWPEVDAGSKSLCYGFGEVTSRLAVCHPGGSRLAIVQDAGIAVIGRSGLSG